jgi:hypothetical protein
VQILILADESVEDSAIQADSRSLATLLLIRDIPVVFFFFFLLNLLFGVTLMKLPKLLTLLYCFSYFMVSSIMFHFSNKLF